MTRKSANRRALDAARAKANGGKAPSARVVREKTTRAWFELKTIHARTQGYVTQLAERMRQYGNPFVLMKISKNGGYERWKELHVDLQKNAVKVAAELESLWDLHKDKKKLCLSTHELEQALRIADMYQAFDTDFYLTFSPIITELNEIFNKALKDLLDAKAELEKNAASNKAVDPTDNGESVYTPVTDTPLPTELKDLDMPAPANAAPPDTADAAEDEVIDTSILTDPSKFVETPAVWTGDATQSESDAGLVIDPNMRNGLIRPNL